MFYTYLWLRYDGTPYYIGKGKGDRAFTHHRNGVNARCPQDKNCIIVQAFLSETDALEAEKILIACYGRIDLGTGCLRNLTDGGDGASGYKQSDALKQWRRESLKGNQYGKGQVPTIEHRLKISQALTGRKHSVEHRRKHSLAIKGVKFSAERRRQMSLQRIGRRLYVPPEPNLKWCGYKRHFVDKEGFNKNAKRCRTCGSEDNKLRAAAQKELVISNSMLSS